MIHDYSFDPMLSGDRREDKYVSLQIHENSKFEAQSDMRIVHCMYIVGYERAMSVFNPTLCYEEEGKTDIQFIIVTNKRKSRYVNHNKRQNSVRAGKGTEGRSQFTGASSTYMCL